MSIYIYSNTSKTPKIQIVTLHNFELKTAQQQYDTNNIPGAIQFENPRIVKIKTLKKIKIRISHSASITLLTIYKKIWYTQCSSSLTNFKMISLCISFLKGGFIQFLHM